MHGNDETMSERIARILAKARQRGLRLGPCTREQELCEFERQHGISLPIGYREFLLNVGNGAHGPPQYGLLKLGDIPDGIRGEEFRMRKELACVRKAFPFTKAWVWERGEISDEGTQVEVHQGNIDLGTDGCGMDWFLIVNGPERGNVWMICGEGVAPTIPKRDFLKWFEDWLDGTRKWLEPQCEQR